MMPSSRTVDRAAAGLTMATNTPGAIRHPRGKIRKPTRPAPGPNHGQDGGEGQRATDTTGEPERGTPDPQALTIPPPGKPTITALITSATVAGGPTQSSIRAAQVPSYGSLTSRHR